MRSVLFSLIIVSTTFAAAEPEAVSATSDARGLHFAVTAGFNMIASRDNLIKKNEGAEIGLITTLPLTLWKEDANLVTVRGQFTNFSNGVDATAENGDAIKLSNASHSQVRVDFRQIFVYWGIHWSAGLGVQIPVTTNILTPRGEYNFTDAKGYYPDAEGQLSKIDKSYAGYLRLGVDQKLLSDTLLLGLALEINLIESPKTQQRFVVNFYAGARVW